MKKKVKILGNQKKIKLKIEELYNDYDWRNVLSFAGPVPNSLDSSTTYGDVKISQCLGDENCSITPIEYENIKEIISYDEGAGDGPDWLLILKLNDNRFAFISAGCDYTGWDCSCGGYCIVSNNLEHLIRYGVAEKDRFRLFPEYKAFH